MSNKCELCDKPVPANLPPIWGELAADDNDTFIIGHVICSDCAEPLTE